ncbi:hypothetical protein VP01_813g2 [Puccinia sorghi]|uniref:Uncharacterized protein n=1 Tax=Puccinia sorghi TaxID=27349 RepID=A0A0L6UA51_9BASI|nr:hypothetical protein VP01_813g2 [Puccinia sorghi]
MQQSATQLVMEDGKASFFAGTLLMVRTAILGANYGLFIVSRNKFISVFLIQSRTLFPEKQRYWQCHKDQPLLLHLSVSGLVVVATAHVLTFQYALWIWFMDPLYLERNHGLWPYAASPLFSGTLIWGVQLILIHRLARPCLCHFHKWWVSSKSNKADILIVNRRLHLLSDQKLRVITVLLLCLAFAQLVLCACRTMEIFGIRPSSFTSIPSTNLYIFPIWLTFVSSSNLILNLLLFRVLNVLKFRFEMWRKLDLSYIVLVAMNLTRVGVTDGSDMAASRSRKSRRITISDLNIEVHPNESIIRKTFTHQTVNRLGGNVPAWDGNYCQL